MATVSVFNFISIDGYYKDLNEDISWHKHGEEEGKYSADSLKAGNILLFGRKTFELMRNFWPTAAAAEAMPEVASGMNNAEKIVFSTTLKQAEWENTSIISENILEEVSKLKQRSEKDLSVLGSGSIVTQLAAAGLVDKYEIMIDPVALGAGTPIFKGIPFPLDLKLRETRSFRSGVVLLTYEKPR